MCVVRGRHQNVNPRISSKDNQLPSVKRAIAHPLLLFSLLIRTVADPEGLFSKTTLGALDRRQWEEREKRKETTQKEWISKLISDSKREYSVTRGTRHLQNPMAREDPKWRSVGASRTGTSGQADTAEEVGLDWTHPQEASIQHHTPRSWPGTRRGRGREAGLATVGGETLKQSWNSRGPTGPEWQEQPKTECDGGLFVGWLLNVPATG